MENTQVQALRPVHQELLKYPALYLLAQVIDSAGEFGTEEVLEAICDKYGLVYKKEVSYRARIATSVANDLFTKKWRYEHTEVVLNIEVAGNVRLERYTRGFKYIKDDKEWRVNTRDVVTLLINGSEIESRNYDEKKVQEMRTTIQTMFEQYQDKIPPPQYAMMAQTIFNRGSLRTNKAAFMNAVQNLTDKHIEKNELEDLTVRGRCDIEDIQARYVFDQFLNYLHECVEENKPMTYVMSLSSFINKNLPYWLNGEVGYSIELKLYSKDEHDEVRRIFMSEPDAGYLQDYFLMPILKVWMQNKRGGTEPTDVG